MGYLIFTGIAIFAFIWMIIFLCASYIRKYVLNNVIHAANKYPVSDIVGIRKNNAKHQSLLANTRDIKSRRDIAWAYFDKSGILIEIKLPYIRKISFLLPKDKIYSPAEYA
ncbi:MAG: hypothetical protein Q4G69_07185 [Planctomycetia bacterium]|nr:hypothetical protein [Planctomycetia bacterium]